MSKRTKLKTSSSIGYARGVDLENHRYMMIVNFESVSFMAKNKALSVGCQRQLSLNVPTFDSESNLDGSFSAFGSLDANNSL